MQCKGIEKNLVIDGLWRSEKRGRHGRGISDLDIWVNVEHISDKGKTQGRE